MKASIEVYEDGKSIIRIMRNGGILIDQYEVSAIALELPKGYITTTNPEGTIRVESRKNQGGR